jgi:hypothetical protein
MQRVGERLRAGRSGNLGGGAQAFENPFMTVDAEMEMHRRTIFHDEVDASQAEPIDGAFEQAQRGLHFFFARRVDDVEVRYHKHHVLGRGSIEIIDFDIAIDPRMDPTDTRTPSGEHRRNCLGYVTLLS